MAMRRSASAVCSAALDTWRSRFFHDVTPLANRSRDSGWRSRPYTNRLTRPAKGALADRAYISLNEAFNRMRGYARGHQVTLADVASGVVAGAIPQDLLINI